MAGDQPPEAWSGRQVEPTVINVAAYEEYGLPPPPGAHHRVGIHDAASKFGATGSLWYDPEDEEEDPPASTFYAWSLVVWPGPEEA